MRSKKLLICLVFLFVSLFALSFNAKVNADGITTDLIKIEGAQVRTAGEPGIRFVASQTLTGWNIEKYGIVFAFGEAEADDNFVIGGTVNGKEVGNAFLESAENGSYAVTLWGIPEVYYTKKITARAYVIADGLEIYSDTVCIKSFAEVVFKAQAEGNTSDLVTNVASAIESNFIRQYTLGDTIVLASPVRDELTYAEFVADANAVLGTNLTTSATLKEFFLALSDCPAASYNSGKSNVTDISKNPIFVLFKDSAMYAKWKPFLEYISTVGSKNPHVANQSKALLNAPTFSGVKDDEYAYPFYYLEHILVTFYNYFNQTDSTIYFSPLKWSVEFTAQPFESTIYADLSESGLIKVGKTFTLPAALEKEGYEFAGWFDGTNTVEGGSEYTITTGGVRIVPTFNTLEYTIKYYNGTTELTDLADTYTVEEEVVLADLEDQPGLTFDGWYENAEFTGAKVSKLAAGTTGNKVYYAKWVEGYSEIVVNAAWANETDGATVTYNGKNYVIGSDAHTSFAAALELLQENGTIYVAPGTYTESFTISLPYAKLVGPNATVAGNGTRAAEAIFQDSVITLAGDVPGTELVGFKFAGTSQIIGNAGAKGASTSVSTYGINHKDFLFENNNVEIGLTSGNGFIVFTEAAHSYTTGAKFLNNYFTFAESVTETTLKYVISMNNTRNVYLNNNVFENILTTVYRVDDTSKGLAGLDNQFNNNTFTNITGSALWFHFISPDKGFDGGVYQNNNNVFDNVSEYCINFAAGNNNDPKFEFQVKDNTFKGTYKVAVNLAKMANPTTFTLTGNIFETEAVTKYFANDNTYGGTTYVGVVAGKTANVANNTYPVGYDTTKFTSAFVFE